MNRSAKQLPLFEDHRDYQLLLEVLVAAEEKCPMRLLEYCVMRNHFHLLLWPERDGDLTRYMRWITGVHGQRWRRARGTSGKGAVYQGRYRWVGVQDAYHLDICRRYILQNPVRAGVAERPQDWTWSSASGAPGVPRPSIAPGPCDELTRVNAPLDDGTADRLRASLRASRNLGSPDWSYTLEVHRWLTDVLARHENALTASSSENVSKTP